MKKKIKKKIVKLGKVHIGMWRILFPDGIMRMFGHLSRDVGSKCRMEQAMMDEMFKMMIVKTRRSFKPPMANMGNYDIGPSVYLPGSIIKGINPDKLKPK